jgi:NAD-dependent deacetylase
MTSAQTLAAKHLSTARRICVLTGAGVSAESGVPTFRASDGLWEGHAIEEVATPEGWRRDPQLVWNFYHARRAKAGSVHPNPGHVALAELQKQLGHASAEMTRKYQRRRERFRVNLTKASGL